jgi:hypothetical protein
MSASAIEQEIKSLAECIWPDKYIEVGPNQSEAEFGDGTADSNGYAVRVRDHGVPVDKVQAGTLERLLEAIELKLNPG